MNQRISDKISDMKISPLQHSMYLKPYRAEFQINGRQKYWDFLTAHDSVAVLIYNTSRKVLVFVRQFRPAMYLAQIPNVKEGLVVDVGKHDLSRGYSLELCAGIVDKDRSLDEIAREEVLEECGYDVPVSSLRKLFSFSDADKQKFDRKAATFLIISGLTDFSTNRLYAFRRVGFSGQKQTIYYVEVTDGQRKSAGGGLREEGEFIEVVELTVAEIRKYLDSEDLLSPSEFFCAVQWFLSNISVC